MIKAPKEYISQIEKDKYTVIVGGLPICPETCYASAMQKARNNDIQTRIQWSGLAIKWYDSTGISLLPELN